jgi:hypothetical protein
MMRSGEIRRTVLFGALISLLPGCSLLYSLDRLAGGSESESGTEATDVFAPSDGGLDSSADDSQAERVPSDSGPDSSASSDTGSNDGGTSDSATEDDGAGADTGTQTGTGNDPDGGGDAEHDALAQPPTVSFTNPLQIDVKALLPFNTVVTTATGGVGLTPIDGTLGGRDFPTRAEAVSLSGTGVGLPNNAYFPSVGMTIPNVQLAWTNATNQGNSLVIQSIAGTSETFDVPLGNYSQLQIYATAANGSSTLNVTLTYTSGNPVTASSTATIPDWCVPGALPPGVYTLATAQRVQNMMINPTLCSIYAINLNPDSTRALSKVAFVAQGTSSYQYVVFYGATAW